MKMYSRLASLILVIFVIVFVYQAVTVYQLRKTVKEDRMLLDQVVNFLNTQVQISQQSAQSNKAVTKK